MKGLVKLENEHPIVSTFDLFEKMGYHEHRTLKRVIVDHKDAFDDIGLLHLHVQKPTRKKSGRPIESYLLNEDHFILLVLLAKNSPESVQLKIRVCREFKRLKKTVALLASQRNNDAWKAERADGKQIYMQKTDVIKIFVEYATEQGSKSAAMYYTNFAKMENKSLFLCHQKLKNVREVLNIRQLNQVACADQIIEKAIQDGMDKEMPYKDVYRMAKERVIEFSKIIGQSPMLAITGQN